MVENKMIVVIAVLLIVLTGIVLFLINLERRTKKLEREVKERFREQEKVSDTEHPGAGGELGAQSGTDPERSEGTKQEKEKEQV